MKPAAAGTASSCLLWVLVLGLLFACLCPVASFIGSYLSTGQAEFVARVLEPYLCPKHSKAEIVTFSTTTVDEYGVRYPATGYELQCVDESGGIVRAPSPDYAFYWIGLLAGVSLLVSGLLALLLAAPAGAWIARRVHRSRKTVS